MSNEDKMREKLNAMAQTFDDAISCADIKDIYINRLQRAIIERDAEIAEARKTAEFWKAEHLAGNEEIASRDLTIKELREMLIQLRMSSIRQRDIDAANEVLANSEHHNSRALEKMLLEARIEALEEVNGLESWVIAREIADYEAKLAELK